MFVGLRFKYFRKLPFSSCSNYRIIKECLSTSENLIEIFKNNNNAENNNNNNNNNSSSSLSYIIF